jgi:pSer/pThr/pTyr-binding forkhead associated (FHA) protein
MSANTENRDKRDSDLTMPTVTTGALRERAAFPYLLRQLEGPGAPRWIKLDRQDLAVGRAEEAEVRVDTNRASRRHAIFHTEQGECTVQDNQSRNGLFLNGVRIHSAVLHDKDILQIADCTFSFHAP